MISDSPMIIDTDTNNPISFIKIFGIVTDKTNETNEREPDFSFYYLKIDDGTGSIWLKSNDSSLSKVNKWDFVQVIGPLLIEKTEENFDLIVSPDSVTVIEDKKWEIVHNLDIKVKTKKRKLKGTTSTIPGYQQSESMKQQVSQQTESQTRSSDETSVKELDTLSSKIENILRSNDSGDGVGFSEIVKLLQGFEESEIDDVLFELAYEGKVYQPKPDYYKIMD
jgi:RPA family protein